MPPQFAKDLELAIRVYQLEAEVTRLQRENDALSKSELELASERNKFADLYDFAPLGYLILTIDAEIVDANLFAARLVGLERRQFLGQCLTDFIHADHREQFREFLTDPDESSGAGSCELKLRTGADQVLDVALQKRHVPEEDGRARIYLTIIDISSRKQIEAERSQLLDEKEEAVRELERTLAMLDALFEEAPVGLAFLDHTFRFQKLNRALAEINGLSIEAHLGKSPTELLPDLAPDMTIHRFEEVKRTGKPVQLQIERDSPLDPTKKRYWWAVYYPIYIRHQLWGIGVIVNENTGRSRASGQPRGASHQ
jgi:PAS domain S-box-containing protein